MTVKIIKGLFAVLHLVLIRGILVWSDYLLWIIAVYSVFTVIMCVVEFNERTQADLKYIKYRD